MRHKGIIKYLLESSGGSRYGYIIPDNPISDYYKDIVFFNRDLEEIEFESLQRWMKVEFVLEQNKNKRGDLQWIARCIRKDLTEEHVVNEAKSSIEAQLHFHTGFRKLFLQKLGDALMLVEQIGDPDEFEDGVFYLLRLIGIHAIYQYERGNQAGKADGFFILENLAVMYDCTLRESFEDYKQEQIENYINKLSNKSQLTIETRKVDGGRGTKTLQILGKTRQVWIITRGCTREIQDFDGIKVKEIAIQDLIKIAIRRCEQLNYESDRLSGELSLLGS